MAKAALPYLNEKSALLTLSYLGAERIIPQLQHHGPGQSLAGSERALSGRGGGPEGHPCERHQCRPHQNLGCQRYQRLWQDCCARVSDASPIRRNVTIEDVGNVAAFLLSDLASGVTAEITYVDGGYSKTMGVTADSAL